MPSLCLAVGLTSAMPLGCFLSGSPGALGADGFSGKKGQICLTQRYTTRKRRAVRVVATGESASHTKVLILGGSGRVGRSTAIALTKLLGERRQGRLGESDGQDRSAEIEVVIAGRNADKGERVVAELKELATGVNASFVACDIDDPLSLRASVQGSSLVVHTAGPFQRKGSCSVLEAAIEARVPYLDVCDDMEYSQLARKLHSAAQAAGVPAITTAGIYPGISNLMAAELVRINCQQEPKDADKSVDVVSPTKLQFSYYTAGSGGAGPTILATSFLLLGEPAGVYQDSKLVYQRPYSQHKVVDFGPGIGKRSTYLLNLPEVASGHEVLGVPSVSARFGTSPDFWNWAMQAMVQFLPPSVLQDRTAVASLVKLSDPLVRVVDSVSGEAVGMRVDLALSNGRVATALYSHKKLSTSVGQCTAAFAVAMLERRGCQPGVWFPEQTEAVPEDEREALLALAAKGTKIFVVNKAPWRLETPPKQVVLGLFF